MRKTAAVVIVTLLAAVPAGAAQLNVDHGHGTTSARSADAPRWSGKFHAYYFPPRRFGAHKVRWRVRPRCEFEACNVSVTSSAGLRHVKFRLIGRTRYVYREPRARRYGHCTVTSTITGQVLGTYSYWERRYIRLTIDRSKDGYVRALRGTVTDHIFGTAAEDAGCTPPADHRGRVVVIHR